MSTQIPSSVTMPTAIPKEQRQRLLGLITNDPDVKESRATNNSIRKAGDLTTDEKVHLVDLFGLFITPQGREPNQLEEAWLYHAFLREVFTLWTSDDEENKPLLLDLRKFPDVSVQAGVLDEDCTEQHQAVVLGGYYTEQHQGNHPGARIAGAPVYLDFFLRPKTEICIERINDEPWHDEIFGGEAQPLGNGWGFLWRDMNGKPVDQDYVALTDNFADTLDAKVAVIRKYDQDKLLRVAKYNRELVITAARRRICKWASDGTETTPRVDKDDSVNAVNVDYETTLASECAEDLFERAERLVTRLRATSS